MSLPNPLPTQKRLKEIFDYNPENGCLYWKKTGRLADSHDSKGYKIVKLDDVSYLQHRLVWMIVYGEDPGSLFIDHINRIPDDNRAENLRLATMSQNKCNAIWSGIYKRGLRWRAQIKHHGKKIQLGTFDCPLVARLAYLDAKQELHGEFCPTK